MSAIDVLARPEVLSLAPYNAGLSSNAVRARYGVSQVARLASNENPYGPSPRVAQALAGVSAELSAYPDANCTVLRAALTQRLGVESDRIVLGNGSEDILQMLCQAFVSAGDQVLTQRPAFGLHEIYPRMMGAKVPVLALPPQLGFDVDAWCGALAAGPKVVMLANPSNPVGCLFTSRDMLRLLDATPDHTLLVIDEAYVEYARLSADHPDMLHLLRNRAMPWVILRTFSKAWGLAGLRVGYGITSDAAIVQWLDRVRTPFNVNHVAQVAAMAALDDEAFMGRGVSEIIRLRGILETGLQALPGIRLAPSAANFLFLDLGRPNGPVNDALLAQGIIVKPWKEPGFEHFIRVSVGTEAENARFLHALAQVLASQPPAAR
ncbi:MAG: histidinol-phosphate transaminase [Limnohabitans sp.]